MSLEPESDVIIHVYPTMSIIELNPRIKQTFDWNLIDNSCAFDIQGAKYTYKFKMGEWDGKYHLFNTNTKTFPTGLLNIIVDILIIEFYEYTIKNYIVYPSYHQFPQWQLQNITLRDYQKQTIAMAIQEKHGIIQIPTGGGKTSIAAGLIATMQVKTIFFVHTKDLLYQTYRSFSKLLTNCTIGIIGDGNAIIGDVTIATIQTVSSKIPNLYGDTSYDIDDEYDEEDIELVLNEKPTDITSLLITQLLDSVQLVIFDESHHIPAQTFYKIAMHIQTPYKFGLSATPFRNDGFDLKIHAGIGKIIYQMKASQLIHEGYLVPITIKMVLIPPQSFPKQWAYSQVYEKYIIDNPIRNQLIAHLANSHIINHEQVLILVRQIRHLNLLHQLIPDSTMLDGSLKTEVRKEILTQFTNKQIPCVIATTLADEGLDVPSLNVLILAGSGKSSTKTLQRIGRVLRLSIQCPQCKTIDVRITNQKEPCICNQCKHQFDYETHHGKTHALVYDLIDQTKFLYDHFLKRKNIYDQESEFTLVKCNIIMK